MKKKEMMLSVINERKDFRCQKVGEIYYIFREGSYFFFLADVQAVMSPKDQFVSVHCVEQEQDFL